MDCYRHIKRPLALVLALLLVFTNLFSVVNANEIGNMEPMEKPAASSYFIDSRLQLNPFNLLRDEQTTKQIAASVVIQQESQITTDTANTSPSDISSQKEQQTASPSFLTDVTTSPQSTDTTQPQTVEINPPPTVPTNVIATADTVTVTIAWDVVPEATGYDIEVDGTVLDNGPNLVFVHEQLISGSQHTYRVRARNLSGTSDWSELLTVTTVLQLGVPSNFTAIATGDTIVVTWDAVPDATGYDIEVDGSVADNGPNTSYSHTGLPVNSTHNYRVRAKSDMLTGAWSGIVTAFTTVQSLEVPQNILAIAESNSIALTWDNVANAMSYDLDINGTVINNITENNYKVTGLSPNMPHVIKIRAVALGVASEWSNPITITTLLETPLVTVDTVFDSGVKLSWTLIPAAESYEIEVDGTVISNGTATSYTHTRLTPSSQHTYKVRAKSAINASNWSELLTVRTLPITSVSGTISKDTVWDVTGSPYVIQGDLTINQGVHLQIMPGVIVKLKPTASMIVNGKVSALGTEAQKIVFTSSTDPAYGGESLYSGIYYWGAINIKSTGELDASNISIRYAGNYIVDNDERAIIVEGKLSLFNSSLYKIHTTGVYAIKSSITTVENTSFSYAGTAITINCTGNAAIAIKNNIIDKCTGIGIKVFQFTLGDFTIQSNNIINGSDYPLYINLNNLGTSIFDRISNNTYAANIKIGVQYNAPVLEGTLKTNLSITNNNLGYIMKPITIPQGFSLDIQPGVVLKGELNQKIIVNGILNAVGTADKPIAFVAIQDAAYGGTGVKSLTDCWEGISVSTTGEFVGDHLIIRDAGYYIYGISIDVKGKLRLTNSVITKFIFEGNGITLATNNDVTIENVKISKFPSGIYVNSTGAGNFVIDNNIIEGCYNGLKINQFGIGELSVQGNSFIKNNRFPFFINLAGLNSSIFENIKNNTYSENISYEVEYDCLVLSGAIKKDISIAANKYAVDDNNLVIPAGLTLTLQPGVIMKFVDTTNYATINGTLNAIGTKDKPIVFTSVIDPKYSGNTNNTFTWWGGIRIGTTGVFNGDYVKASYAYSLQSSSYPLFAVFGALNLQNSEIKRGYDTGIYFDTPIQPTLRFNTFAYNTYGVYNKRYSTMTIDAEYNYWSSPYGPGIKSNKVTAGVDYTPWLGEEFKYQRQFGQEGVNGATGNYSKAFTDMSIGIPGFELDITRTYNSSDDRANQVLGRGWSFGYESSITDYVNGTMKVVRLPNGGVQTFEAKGDGTYTAVDSRSKLEKLDDNTFVLTNKEQYQYGFNAKGHLSWIKDRNNNTITIHVDTEGRVTGLTDQAQRQVGIVYQSGKIYQITDPSNRKVTYEYTNGLLTKVIDPTGAATTYTYDSAGYLSEIKDHDLNQVEAVSYNHNAGENQHKVNQVTDNFGNVLTYSYDNVNKKTTIMDINGRETVKWYDSSMYITNSKDAEGKLTTTEYALDAAGINYFGEAKSETDRNGNKTLYDRDANGNIIKITNPDNSTKILTYDAKNNLTSQKDESGKFTYYVYNAESKNLLKTIQPLNGTDAYTETSDPARYAVESYEYYTDAESQQLGYNTYGLLKAYTDANGGTFLYTYDQYGNQKTVKDPETNKTTSNEYNASGVKTAEVTAAGYRTEYTYDLNGRLEKQTLHGGETTRIIYDKQGRKTKEVDGNLYNPLLDDLTAHTYSGNHGYRYTYYANGMLQSKIDSEDKLYQYAYDIYGNLTTEIKPNGSFYLYEYDVMNRKTKTYIKESEQGTPVLLEEFAYFILTDKKTKQVHTKYLNGTETAVTSITYDYANRPVEQLSADGTKTLTSYYANGMIKSVTNPRNVTIYYTYDGMNRLTDKWVPLEQPGSTILYTHHQNVYDKAGRVIEEKVGKSKVVYPTADTAFTSKQFAYYKNGWLKSIIDMEGRSTEYVYDSDGNVMKEIVKLDESSSKITEYVYNHLKKPEVVKLYAKSGDIAGNDFANNDDLVIQTRYTYDKNGNLLTITAPNNVTTTYTYDRLNRQLSMSQPGVDEIDNAAVISTSVTYDWNGNVLTSQDAKGNITTNVYNLRGMLEKVIDANQGTTAYYYDTAGRKIAEVSPQNYDANMAYSEMSRTEFLYDKMDRVKTITNVYFDNITGQWISVVAKAFKYGSTGNLLKELDALGYLAGTGATVDEKINSGYGKEYSYNFINNLLTVLDPVSKDRNLSYTVKYDYDSAGRKTSELNANGVKTNYYYDVAGNIVSIGVQKSTTAAEQIIERNTYDLANNLITRTDGNGNITLFEYNSLGKLRKAIYPGDSTISANTVISQYDVMGNLKLKQDSAGLQERYTYDNQGRTLSQTKQREDGTEAITLHIKYDKNGNKRFEIDGNGNTTESVYDQLNRLKQVKRIVSGKLQTTAYEYDKYNNLISTTDWRNNTYTQKYDPLNRLIEKKNPESVVIERLEYNHNGAQTKAYDSLGNFTAYQYDKNGRLLNTTDPENHVTSQTYDNVGNIKTKKDGRNNITTFNYDEFNRLLSVVNAKSETTSYTYDLNGNMLTMTDGKGNITTYEYNAANLPVRKINHGGRIGSAGSYTYDQAKTESYTYDAVGKISGKLDRNGVTTVYTYDVHGRLFNQTTGQIQISYTYDNNGNQLTMVDSTGTTTRTYDELNRVLTKAVPNIGTVNYVYDITSGMAEGRYAEKTIDPKGNITLKVYDTAGRIAEVKSGGASTTYSYYDNGARKTVLYPSGASEEYTYYKDNLLKTLINRKADGSVINEYSYTYDAAHNQTSKVDERGTTSYVYDALNRLERVTEPGAKTITYTYDKAGNRLTETVVQGTNTTSNTYSYNEQNRLNRVETRLNSTLVATQEFVYDNNGNQLRAIKIAYAGGVPQHAVQTINTYDDLNRLIETSANGNTAAYTYNGEGFRVKKDIDGQVINYLYEYDKVVLELDEANGQIARNIYGTNLLVREIQGQTAYYMYNGHGDVTALLGNSGEILATYYYDAFGNLVHTTGNINNPYRYAGYQYDEETNLYYLNSRMYDPNIARFLQEDTYTGNPKDPLSLNLYTYSHNNPITYDDPNGHWIHIVAGGLLGGVLSAAIDVGTQMLFEKKSFKEIDWKSVGVSALEGAATGAIGAATGGASLAAAGGKQVAKLTGKKLLKKAATTMVSNALGDGAINATAQAIVKGKVDWNEVKTSTVTSFFTAGLGFDLPDKSISKAVKETGSDLANKFKNGISNIAENLDNALNPKMSLAGIGNIDVPNVAKFSNVDNNIMKNSVDSVNIKEVSAVGKLKYKPSSGVELIATQGKTTTVLGSYAKDTGSIINELGNVKSADFGPKTSGFNLLNVPDELYQNPKQFWNEYNQPWLDNAINRQDIILMATKPEFKAGSLFRKNSSGKFELSGFGKEYLHLRKSGFVFDSNLNQMIMK